MLLDDEAGTITITDANNNTVTLAATGITLERGSAKIELTDASVSVNGGALEVT